ncbi:hypothetical protein NKH77_25250 [Streptomyces sp. M19]
MSVRPGSVLVRTPRPYGRIPYLSRTPRPYGRRPDSSGPRVRTAGDRSRTAPRQALPVPSRPWRWALPVAATAAAAVLVTTLPRDAPQGAAGGGVARRPAHHHRRRTARRSARAAQRGERGGPFGRRGRVLGGDHADRRTDRGRRARQALRRQQLRPAGAVGGRAFRLREPAGHGHRRHHRTGHRARHVALAGGRFAEGTDHRVRPRRQVGVRIGPGGPPTVDRINQGDEIAALGARNVTYADLRALPGDPPRCATCWRSGTRRTATARPPTERNGCGSRPRG